MLREGTHLWTPEPGVFPRDSLSSQTQNRAHVTAHYLFKSSYLSSYVPDDGNLKALSHCIVNKIIESALILFDEHLMVIYCSVDNIGQVFKPESLSHSLVLTRNTVQLKCDSFFYIKYCLPKQLKPCDRPVTCPRRTLALPYKRQRQAAGWAGIKIWMGGEKIRNE